MSDYVVYLKRNNKYCYYIADNISFKDGKVSFYIEGDLYVYEISFLAYSDISIGILDCTKLKLLYTTSLGGNI